MFGVKLARFLPASLLKLLKKSTGKGGGVVEIAAIDDRAMIGAAPDETAKVSATLSAVIREGGQLLTAPKDKGGTLEIAPELRPHIAVYENGLMLINYKRFRDPALRSIETRAKLSGIVIKKVLAVGCEVIQDAYRRGALDSASQIEMQKAILDLIHRAYRLGASDIHIAVGETMAVVEMRCNGTLKETEIWEDVGYAHEFCSAAFYLATNMDSNYNPNEPQGINITQASAAIPDELSGLRGQYIHLTHDGRYLVLRLLPKAANISKKPSITNLGYHPVQQEKLMKLIGMPEGIVLVTGPTGSGKSTTLYNVIRLTLEACNRERNALSIEDPPEYDMFPYVKQVPMMGVSTAEERTAKLTQYKNAFLRQDPDIIILGEIRDKPSADSAFEMAMTGHLVLGTLHTNSAILSLNRLEDLGVDRHNLYEPGLIGGIVAQRLVRSLCPDCRIPIIDAYDRKLVPADMWTRIIASCEIEGSQIYWANTAGGCPTCGERKGYGDREVVSEILMPDETFMTFMREGMRPKAVDYWLTSLGGMTMLDHAKTKMKAGIIPPTEVDRVIKGGLR